MWEGSVWTHTAEASLGRQNENEVYWSTSTWLALQAQRLSVAVHIASAWEITTDMQLAGGGGEAPSSDEKGAATA